MKKLIYFLFSLSFIAQVSAQPNTEVYLFDLKVDDKKTTLSNPQNISNNEGYDSQPSFYDTENILFSSTRNGQTDILKYHIPTQGKEWLSDTKQGSEYSPTRIKGSKHLSSIRLDTTGKQLLYKYNFKNGKSKPIVNDLVIGYHTWFNKNTLISFVLGEPHKLVVSDLKKKINTTADTHIGRSLHHIPNTVLISYISKKNENAWEIRSLNPTTGETKKIIETLPNAEDMCWLPDGSILMGKGKAIYRFNPKTDTTWQLVTLFSKEKFDTITRIIVNKTGTKLALVAELEKVLEPKLENIKWIAGNWKGEAFGGIAEENWSLPSGGSMMATFKLIADGKVQFYEIETISEVNNSLLLRLKHFNNELKGWETKDETVDFPLIRITPERVIFEGMTFEYIDEKTMNVYVDIRQKDTSVATVKFNYRKD